MKTYVHARLGHEEEGWVKQLKELTGETVSQLVKKGLRLVYEKEVQKKKSLLELAGDSVGKFSSPIQDLSTNKKHMEGYGK